MRNHRHRTRHTADETREQIRASLLDLDALAFERGDRLTLDEFIHQARITRYPLPFGLTYPIVLQLAQEGRLKTLTDRPTLRVDGSLYFFHSRPIGH